jgi:hypothetical protein
VLDAAVSLAEHQLLMWRPTDAQTERTTGA